MSLDFRDYNPGVPNPLDTVHPVLGFTFAYLAEESRPKLYAAALKMTRNPDDAEDIVQEALFKAHRAFLRFRADEAAPESWLYRILVNAFLDYKRKLTHRRYEPISDNFPDTRVSTDPESTVLGRMAEADIANAIARLSPDHRVIITLGDIYGYTYREISDLLGIPKGTVQSRLSRGRDCLEQILRRKGYAADYLS